MKAGRPFGATTRPQFHTYVTEIERKEYVAWVRKNFKKNSDLAKWYGDQMFGKATQPIAGADGGPLIIEISAAVKNKYSNHAPQSGTGTNSK